MSSPQETFEERLKEARTKYVNSLPAKISEIKLIWNQLNHCLAPRNIIKNAKYGT
jgi:hypothetical protein